MTPKACITEWASQVHLQTNEQVEQDLVICRALVEIFKSKSRNIGSVTSFVDELGKSIYFYWLFR